MDIDRRLPKPPLLLDGGMGRELQARGVALSQSIWSAAALINAPDIVRQIHQDYICAGADMITTNTYGLIREDLARAGLEHRYDALNRLAGQLAREACDREGRATLVAGSLPPLRGSFRPDRVGPRAELLPAYQEQAALLAPYVDLFLCETMSSAAEACVAAEAALTQGKPVWVSWTLHEDASGRLRSGETIARAVSVLETLPVSGILVNCSSPESVSQAIPELAKATDKIIGGYANTFSPIPEDWRLDGEKETDGLLSLRNDLPPDAYGRYAEHWLLSGAGVVGGCCGTGPDHIREIRRIMDQVKDLAR